MGRISRRRIEPEIEERVFEIFWDYLANLKATSDVHEFLTSLLSHTEQVMLAKRLAIAVLLGRGYTYESIDQTLKVSKATVATVHKQILVGASGYQKAVTLISKKEQGEQSVNRFEEIILKLMPAKQYGSLGWEVKSATGKRVAKRKRKLSAL